MLHVTTMGEPIPPTFPLLGELVPGLVLVSPATGKTYDLRDYHVDMEPRDQDRWALDLYEGGPLAAHVAPRDCFFLPRLKVWVRVHPLAHGEAHGRAA